MKFSVTKVDFVGRWRTWAKISGAAMLVSIVALVALGLNLSIDFVGGSSFVIDEVTTGASEQDLREAAEGAGATDVTAQLTGGEDGNPGAIIRMGALEPGSDELVTVRDAIVEAAGPVELTENFVGPTWGEQVSRKAIEALVVFLIVVVIYITIRLELKMAGVAVVALVHDLVITVGIYALLRFTVSPATIIALLTILGYSLYDTVVVFDRVKEVSEQVGEPGRRTMAQVTNVAMNDVLWRSINTSLTSLAPVGALLFLGGRLLGASTLEDLALALFVGMALGTYSSLFVAGPGFALWKMTEPEQIKLAERAVDLGEEEAVTGALPDAAVVEARAPITTEYVRGRGRKSRRRR
ncbi:MAG: protein translocase subunit SecF [Nitriliruptorales bacterium]|nr:protein translocase subunit SecF [Nitriliruptorales bacterium]